MPTCRTTVGPARCRQESRPSSFTWSANCVLPGRSSDVPDDVIVNGAPEYKLKSPFTCQPPSSAAATPPSFSHGLPRPNGSSATNDAWKLCGRSCGRRASLRDEVVERLHLRRIVAQRVAADAERLRPGVGDVRLQTLREPSRQRRLQRIVVAPSRVAENAGRPGPPESHEQRPPRVAGADHLTGVGVHDLVDVALPGRDVAGLARNPHGSSACTVAFQEWM